MSAEWVWCGYAGHFAAANKCRFHLHTRVGGFRVSTVGDYWPTGASSKETLGAGPDSFFETFVFRVSGHGSNGEGEVDSWCEIDSERYATAEAAERGHIAYCAKYSRAAP